MDFKIKLSADSGTTSEISRENIRAGIVRPPEWAGRYTVQIEDGDFLDDYAPIEFRGSSEAREEFKSQRYHLVLEVEQEDLANEGGIRPLRYLRPVRFTDFEFVGQKRKAVSFLIKTVLKDGSDQE